jgi:hypothetical protein
MFLTFILPLLDSISQTRSKSTFLLDSITLLFFYFFVGLCSQSVDKLTIHSIRCIWNFVSRSFLKVYPPICTFDYSTCNNAKLKFCSTLLKICQEGKLESTIYNLTFLMIVELKLYSSLNFKSNTFSKLIQFFGKI